MQGKGNLCECHTRILLLLFNIENGIAAGQMPFYSVKSSKSFLNENIFVLYFNLHKVDTHCGYIFTIL